MFSLWQETIIFLPQREGSSVHPDPMSVWSLVSWQWLTTGYCPAHERRTQFSRSQPGVQAGATDVGGRLERRHMCRQSCHIPYFHFCARPRKHAFHFYLRVRIQHHQNNPHNMICIQGRHVNCPPQQQQCTAARTYPRHISE